MGVVVVPVLVAVVVGRVMGDRAIMTRDVVGVLDLGHSLSSANDCRRPRAVRTSP
jgi:hypothetical protein